jgi:hypothetical protein
MPPSFSLGVRTGIIFEQTTEAGAIQVDATATGGVGHTHRATAAVPHRQMHARAVTVT